MGIQYKSGEEVIPVESLFFLEKEQKEYLMAKFGEITKKEHEKIYSDKEHDKKIKMCLNEEQVRSIVDMKNTIFSLLKENLFGSADISDNNEQFLKYLKEEEIIIFTPHASEMLWDRLSFSGNNSEDMYNPFEELRNLNLGETKIEDLQDEIILILIESDYVEDRIEWAPINKDNKSLPRINFRKDMDQTTVCSEIYTEFLKDGSLVRIITIIKKNRFD